MKIEPKEGILLIKKHKNTAVKVDIAIEESDEDKALITGEVLKGSLKGKSVVFGKYSLFELLIQGERFYFLPEEDIIAITEYKE